MLRPDHSKKPIMGPNKLRAIWEAVKIEPVEFDGPALQEILANLRESHANGGAEFASFHIEGGDEFMWFISRGYCSELEFPERFLRTKAVVDALPDLCEELSADPFGFEELGSFLFSGKLAQAVYSGGAYGGGEGGPGGAFAIADDFRKLLFGDRFHEVVVYSSYKPWSVWFFDVAWDATWLIIDRRHSRVSVLAVTDTD